ncbi:hypothetical protein [Carboxylicivirga caseinilyticus]|uniref:hypothetical protein n=1 Tax=Carboxylicivirga caseinilyticus TaxID=3417572 RepID=UPI003D358017|nr:hypothetical protein [Marinilabiliaceae bacterium A049]
MRTFLLFICVIFATNISRAQITNIDSLRISGVVFEQDSLHILPYSQFNIHSQRFTSNEQGQFSFWAKKGEIIKFSYLGFKDTYIQIEDSLDLNNYIMGVFLTRDTIQIGEVIVVPRYENLTAQARNMPLLITPDQAYAQNNIKSSTNQALTQPPLKMDREMNQDMVLREQRWGTVYKTQIPPDRTIGITSENLGTMSLFVTPRKEKIRATIDQPLNRHELDLILRIYEEKVKAMLGNQ